MTDRIRPVIPQYGKYQLDLIPHNGELLPYDIDPFHSLQKPSRMIPRLLDVLALATLLGLTAALLRLTGTG
jgi:hypothetical protein